MRIERIRAALSVLSPERLEVDDESHRHVGHAGARDGRGHFAVSIVSEQFAGQGAVTRHRRIYDALGTMMQTDIHALSISARTPAEVDKA